MLWWGGAPWIGRYNTHIGPSVGVVVTHDMAVMEVQGDGLAGIGFPWGMTEDHDFGVEPIGRQFE